MQNELHILAEEKQVFALVALGDQFAFSTVFRHYSARIYPFVLRMTRSEEAAEEIVQDVFLKVWNKRESLHSIENYGAWIYTIATNHTYNYLKMKAREKKKEAAMQHVFSATNNTTLEAIDFRESVELINKAIDQLSPQRKIIYKKSREEGLTFDEIAAELRISKYTVKNQLIAALKHIKNHLNSFRELFALFLLKYFL